jgi:hypothetical protein
MINGSTTNVWFTGNRGLDYEIRRAGAAVSALTLSYADQFAGIGTDQPLFPLHVVRATTTGSLASARQLQISNRNDSNYGLRLGYYDVISPAAASYGVIQSLENGNGGILVLNPQGATVAVGGLPPANASSLHVQGSMRVTGLLTLSSLNATASLTAAVLSVTNQLTAASLSVTTNLSVAGVANLSGGAVASTVAVSQNLTTVALTCGTLNLTSGVLAATNLSVSSLNTTGSVTATSITSTGDVAVGAITATNGTFDKLNVGGGFGNIYAYSGVLTLAAITNVASIPASQGYAFVRVGNVASLYATVAYVTNFPGNSQTVRLTLPEPHGSVVPLGTALGRDDAMAYCASTTSVSGSTDFLLTLRCPSYGSSGITMTMTWHIAVTYTVS